ncbi:hypothetical protein ABBQ32_008652 [Trebouxia sp. C0010 RCD-2024]
MKELYSKALSSLSIASLRSTKVKADLRLYQCMGLHATSRKKVLLFTQQMHHKPLDSILGVQSGVMTLPHKLRGLLCLECSVGKVLYSLTINSADAESDLPFKIKRRQSPLQESFALTINKSQGGTLASQKQAALR